MLAGEKFRSPIREFINIEIITKLEQKNFDRKTIVLLDGLRLLVEKTGETGLLFPLYEK
jgi:hypothetical protein